MSNFSFNVPQDWHSADILQNSLDPKKKKSICDIYPRTKHGTISPFSILLSHDEHTPWWIGPSPSERDDY